MFRFISKFSLVLFIFISIIGMVACEDDSVNENVFKIQASQLEGEWISDNWEQSPWEIMKFSSVGGFYYANEEIKDWDTSAGERQGRYRIIRDDMLECSFYSDDITFTRYMILSEISDLKFTAKCYERENIAIKSYVKLLESYQMEWDETIRPDYIQLLGENILEFKSLNHKVADVDTNTGEIKAKLPGRALINVATKDRTAVIEVSVSDFWPDYIQYFGKSIEEIKEIFGTPLYEGLTTTFKIEDDKLVKAIGFKTSNLSPKIDRVILNLKDDCDRQMIVDYLKEKYYLDDDATNSDMDDYVFYNKKTYRESVAMISYHGSTNSILYLYLNN